MNQYRSLVTQAGSDQRTDVAVSVIVPVYNESRNVLALHDSIRRVMQGFGRTYEMIVVDDGSRDGTREILRGLAADDPNLRVVLFRRNYGQTAAMAAGFDHARGAVVVSMDGDLQNDPVDIPRLIHTLEQGHDIVCGWRRYRRDRFITRLLPSRIANYIVSWVTRVPIHDTGCSLRAYRSWVIRNLTLYSEMHRFIAALAAGVGARVSEVAVRHHPRRHGQSKYGLGRVFRVLGDLIVIKMLIQFSAHPLRWFSLMSLPLFVAAAVLFLSALFEINDHRFRSLRAFDVQIITAASVTLLVAFNMLLLGFLAELQLKASHFIRRQVTWKPREGRR